MSAQMRTGWEPLLGGLLEEQALEAITAIATDLRNNAHADESALASRYPFSLGFGSAGIAVFFAYMHALTQCPLYESETDRFLRTATSALQTHRMVPDLFRGIAGIGWAYEHIQNRMHPEKNSGACDEIDSALARWCSLDSSNYELLEGIAGICVYAAERSSRKRSLRLFAAAVSRLERSADRLECGRAWPAKPAVTRDYIQFGASRNSPLYGMGVAHGVAGTTGAVALACEFIRDVKTLVLLRDVTRWIVSNYTGHTLHCFPNIVGLDLPRRTSGWCNGDLGIALVLLGASTVLNSEELRRLAIVVASKEATKGLEEVEWHNRQNYTLCHGSAGRAHIFGRLFRRTGIALFRDAARNWFSHTLRIRQAGFGTGGFLVDEPQLHSRKNVCGFLMGASGLGLALISAVSKVEPSWDRVLLAGAPTGQPRSVKSLS